MTCDPTLIGQSSQLIFNRINKSFYYVCFISVNQTLAFASLCVYDIKSTKNRCYKIISGLLSCFSNYFDIAWRQRKWHLVWIHGSFLPPALSIDAGLICRLTAIYVLTQDGQDFRLSELRFRLNDQSVVCCDLTPPFSTVSVLTISWC